MPILHLICQVEIAMKHITGFYKGMNVKRKATRRLKTSISMYMPPSTVDVSYGAGYKDEPIGTLAENVLASI